MLKVVRSFAFRQADRDDLFSGSRNPTVEIDTDIQRAVQSLDLVLPGRAIYGNGLGAQRGPTPGETSCIR